MKLPPSCRPAQAAHLSAKADGRWGKQDFVYQPESDIYRCPAGETMTRRFATVEQGLMLHGHATPACRSRCTVKASCTDSIQRRIKRWEHEEVIEAMQVRRRTVEHALGTIKDGMGRSRFKTRRLKNVGTEIGLTSSPDNIRRAVALVGVPSLMAAMQA